MRVHNQGEREVFMINFLIIDILIWYNPVRFLFDFPYFFFLCVCKVEKIKGREGN